MPVANLNRKIGGLVLFVLISGAMFSVFYFKAGGSLPFRGKAYTVSFVISDAAGLVRNADVRAAGVSVGKVETVPGQPRRHGDRSDVSRREGRPADEQHACARATEDRAGRELRLRRAGERRRWRHRQRRVAPDRRHG